MLRIAREIILVADASKFSKRSMVRIAPFSEIDIIISDTGLRTEIQEKVRGAGCNLMLA
jgi:DeoR/GlpR family transcriptional regulator of sugar metabolism